MLKITRAMLAGPYCLKVGLQSHALLRRGRPGQGQLTGHRHGIPRSAR